MTDQPHDLSIVVLQDDLDTLRHGSSITAEAWSPDDPHGMPAEHDATRELELSIARLEARQRIGAGE